MSYHLPVMVDECLLALDLKPNGLYVDLTLGGGGHAKAILERLKNGSVVAFDQDADTQPIKNKLSEKYGSCFQFVNSNFRYFEAYLKYMKVGKVDGVLMDLGVSSHQIDTPERGFSIRHSGLLDMRMNREQKERNAYDVINSYDVNMLKRIFFNYGEINNAAKLAYRIVEFRSSNPIQSTSNLVEVIKPFAIPKKENQYLARVFQAIRMEVNEEIDSLKEALLGCVNTIKPKGRLVVIAYHSIEDRIVKNFMKKGKFDGEVNKDFYGNLIRPFEPLNKKPFMAKIDEIGVNPRARSAKLRVAVKN